MKKILLIEDDPAILIGLSAALKYNGLDVVTASDGLEGYKLAKSIEPDLLLLDVMLPSMKGFEICEMLKREEYLFPIFMLTSLADNKSKIDGLTYGADDYISKPFNLQELIIRIKNTLKHSEKIQQNMKDIENDVKKASLVQKNSLPQNSPDFKGLDIFGKMLPSRIVGGDYYDYLIISPTKIAVLIADVCDKGMAAALFVQKMQSVLTASVKSINSSRDVLTIIQKYLINDLDKSSFITASAMLFDLEKRSVDISRAGHLPLIHIRENNVNIIKPAGIMINRNFRNSFEEKLQSEALTLKTGDLFCLFSDGITEATNKDGIELGEVGFENILLSASGTANQITEYCLNEVENYTQFTRRNDDQTIVVVKVLD
jgi:serine phosphatase RsbU (regulator of sigma subunit)